MRGASSSRSFDHLVGKRNQLVRNLDAKRLGRLQVDDQLELGRLLNGRPPAPRAESYRRTRRHAATGLESSVRRTSDLPLRRILASHASSAVARPATRY